MKYNRTIEIMLVVITLIAFAGAVYTLVLSIMGKGNWALTISLGLVCLGNGLNIIAQRLRKKNQAE